MDLLLGARSIHALVSSALVNYTSVFSVLSLFQRVTCHGQFLCERLNSLIECLWTFYSVFLEILLLPATKLGPCQSVRASHSCFEFEVFHVCECWWGTARYSVSLGFIMRVMPLVLSVDVNRYPPSALLTHYTEPLGYGEPSLWINSNSINSFPFGTSTFVTSQW